jgi:hypothetical protein
MVEIIGSLVNKASYLESDEFIEEIINSPFEKYFHCKKNIDYSNIIRSCACLYVHMMLVRTAKERDDIDFYIQRPSLDIENIWSVFTSQTCLTEYIEGVGRFACGGILKK